MNLKDFTIQSIGSYPLIHKLRKLFSDNDRSVFLSPKFITQTTVQKYKQINSNFTKIFQALEPEDQAQVTEILPYLEYIAPVGSQYINLNAFYPPLKILASDEQLLKWGTPFLEGRCIGAFAQTEISHGSDVQSLQTTATYNLEKKCFILNSPNIGSIKIWSGLSGMLATHIILQAQTHINGKRYGLQAYVVPIRDPKTYKLFPGVEAWDIGPKLGSNLVDDGSLKFTNYEIPRDCLLMKFLKVEEDGTVAALGGKDAIKIGYGGMLSLRVRLMKGLLRDSYKSLMIWYRSCLAKGEIGMLQKSRIINEFSYIYAGIATIEQVTEIYKLFLHNIRSNVKAALGGLEELHLIVSGLKTFYAWGVIDQARRFAMEGSVTDLTGAGIVDIYADRVPASTYEGDSAVMLQQVARGLCKYMHYTENDEGSKIPPFFKWIVEAKGRLEESGEVVKVKVDILERLIELENIEEVIDMIGLVSLKENSDRMKSRIMGGGKIKKVWNEEVQKGMVDMGLTVTRGMTFKMAKKNLASGSRIGNMKKEDLEIVKDLLCVYGLGIIKKNMNVACRFKVEDGLGTFEDVVVGALEMVVKRLEKSLGYIGESSPYSDEDLFYVRDYRELAKGSESVGKMYNEEVEKCINAFSKL